MDEADFILFNGRIWTADAACPRAEALAVADGRIAMVGSNRQVLQAFPFARRLDASYLTILPGFIDAHVHLVRLGAHLLQLDLSGAGSVDEAVRIVEAANAGAEEAGWLIGGGWDHTRWPGAIYPTRHDLDRLVPDRPVWLRRVDLHVGWANSAALQAASVDASTPDVAGGLIRRDASGAPTGILVDRAMELVERVLPAADASQHRTCVEKAIDALHAEGITGAHDAGASAEVIDLYREMIDAHALDLRLNVMADGMGAAYHRLVQEGAVHHHADRLNVRSVKLFMDGALGSRGAALLSDYADEPGNAGLLMYEPQELEAHVREISAQGLQVCTHAIGDRAVRHVLDAYERAMSREQRDALRPRVEHAQVVHEDDLGRFGALGVIASMQPVHEVRDRAWAAARLGQDRLPGAYAWGRLDGAGARLAFGSDAPVETADPRAGFAAAISSVDREIALRAYTIDAAHAGFQEEVTGSITRGKHADLVVLEEDLTTVDAAWMPEGRVVATFVGGRCVFGGW